MKEADKVPEAEKSKVDATESDELKVDASEAGASEGVDESLGTSQTSQTSQTAEPATEPPKPEKLADPDWKDQYARLLADFDNFKKRTARDREDTYRFAEADILKDILPTVDNLSLAIANAKDPESEFVKGVKLVYDSLLKALREHNAEPFDSVGLALDTEKMEAIATLPNAEVEEGKVSIESKKGWMLKGKVLRAAQVVVSSGPQTP